MHMISKKDLSDVEMSNLTKSCSPTIVITANGEVQTHKEATVYVKELDILLTLKVLENTPAVLSLGKLCDENGYSYEWIHGQEPHLIKNGFRILCNTENFVPIVVPGLSSSSSGSSSTSKTPSRQESHSSPSSSASSSSPTVSEIQTREREDRIESDISPVQVSSSVDDRSGQPDDNSRSLGPERQLRISKQSSICSRGAGSSHSMDPGAYPCKNKSSQETQRSLQKYLEPERKPKVIYTDNSLEFGKLVEIFPGIIARPHHTDQKQMGLLKEQCAE